jgi:hypothetical protein
MCVRNGAGPCDAFVPFAAVLDWALSAGGDGPRDVFVRLRDAAGNAAAPPGASATIRLDTGPAVPAPTVWINGGAQYANSQQARARARARVAAAAGPREAAGGGGGRRGGCLCACARGPPGAPKGAPGPSPSGPAGRKLSLLFLLLTTPITGDPDSRREALHLQPDRDGDLERRRHAAAVAAVVPAVCHAVSVVARGGSRRAALRRRRAARRGRRRRDAGGLRARIPRHDAAGGRLGPDIRPRRRHADPGGAPGPPKTRDRRRGRGRAPPRIVARRAVPWRGAAAVSRPRPRGRWPRAPPAPPPSWAPPALAPFLCARRRPCALRAAGFKTCNILSYHIIPYASPPRR